MPEELRPLISLISKSEKAQQRLRPGTWQHSMLRDNIRALRIAVALMDESADNYAKDDLQEAVRALDLMIRRTEDAQAKFSAGTAQHTLQRNRLKALRIAEARTQAELRKR